MTTFSDQTLDLGRIRAIPKALTLPEPVEPAPAPAAPVESSAADTLDTYIRQNRAVTPRSVTEMRKVPRASIEEINDTDFEELRSRMLALGDRDTRSPAMKFLDLIDAPRNVIMSVLNSDLRKKAEAEGNTGTFGLGRVQFSDLLRSAGVNNRVAAGVLGFVGDLAFDPLTYIGPAGWGAKIGTTTKAGRAVSVGLRRTGKTALDRQIARLAAGGAEVVDEAAHGYLTAKAAQKGFTSPQEWISTLAGQGKDAKGIRNEIARTVYGDPSKSVLERVFRPLGGERTMERAAPAADDVGNFAYDFFRSDSATDAAGMAARKFVEKYGEGTGKALRFGKAKGGVGSQILHVPFLDQYTVQVSPFTAGAVRALDNARLAMRAGDAVSSAPGEVGRPFLSLADELVNDEQELVTISEAKVQAAADHAAARMSYSDDLPEMPPDPDLPPSTDPVPPPGPTPIVPGGLEIPPNAPERTSNYIVGDFVQPQPVKPVQGRIDFDVEGRAQELLDAGDAVEMDEALDMARMEQAALERQAAESAGAGVPPSTIGTTQEAGNAIKEGRQEGREGLLSPGSATTTPPAVDEAAGALPRTQRERVLGEVRVAFSNVPPEQQEKWAKLVDARAQTWAREGKGRTPDQFWEQLRVEKGKAGEGQLYDLAQRKGQSPLASLSFEQDGAAVMRALKSPNITSLVHESSHLFLPGLADQDLNVVARVYGVTPELLRVRSEQLPVADRTRWVRAHEHFARDFEKYAATGRAPTKELESVFAKLKDWFVAIYKKIIGTPLEREIDPRIRGVFDRMLGGVDDGSGLAVPSGKATRSMVWDRLKESVADTMEALNDGVVNTDDRLAEFSNATTFYKSIPTELKMALQRPGGEAIRRQFIRVEKLDPTKAGGEDAVVGAFGGDWDAFVEHLMDLAGSGRRKVLAAAEMNLNARPDVPFWRRLWDNWPGAGAKSDVVKMDDLDVPSAGPDVAFTVNGDEMRTMLDENGHLVVAYGDDAATVPAELVGTLPVDPGSVRRVTDEDLPDFNPDDPLFQRDVSGQGGLFGSRVGRISSGEQQGGLFGSVPEVPAPKPEVPTGDPERMLGESDAAYRDRVALHRKWSESAKNTNTLFQDDLGGGQPNLIPTKTPRQIFDEQHAAAMEAMDKQYKETLGRIAEKRDRIVKELEAFDPKTAAPTVATLNDLLKLGEMRDNADSLLQLEMRRARTAKMAQAIDAADDPVFRSQEVGERLYNLVRNDPKAASDYADAITARMEALNAYRESIKATLADIADADELEVASLAKSLLGTDDASIALSVFAAPARFLRDKFGENSAAFQYAEAMDRFWRRTFGVRRGTTTQLLTDISADMTARPISERMHAMSRMIDRVDAMKLPLERDDAMNLLHAYVYKHLGDTVLNGGAFAWKIGPEGQNLGDSEMVQLLKRAQDAGALTPANIQALKQAAAEHVDEMKRLGFSEQDYGVLGLLRPDYVYSPATKDAQKAMRLHAEAGSANPNVARAGPAFARARTLDQVRFPMQNPDDLLASAEAETRWHRFFVGDMALADVPDDMLRPEQLTAKAAVVDYLKRVEEDPEFAAKFPPRPSDPMEINELAAQGRFQHVTGGAPIDKMKETDLSVVYGLRMGQHQHAMGMARLGEFLQRESFQIDPALFDQWERSPGKVLRLRGGTSARVVTNLKSNLDRAVSGVRIGDTVYRRLDSSLWSTGNNVLGNLFARMADGRGSKTPITLEHLLVHHAVADKIEDMLRLGEPKRFEELLHTADTLTGMWKQLTLMHPAWVVFNIIGDTANALAGGTDPRTLVDAQRGRELMDVYRYRHNPERLAEVVVGLRDGREMTGTEFWNAVTNSRVVDNTLSSEAMLKIVEDNPGLLDAADRTMRKYTAPWFRANQSLQDWMRMMVFSSFLDQGVDTPIAAKRVLESIGDYSDFTKVEERFFRRVFPFYSWMRNNLGYQIMQLGQRPGYVALMPKLHTALEEATAGDAAVPENMRPGWMRDQLATQIGADPKSRISLMLGSALPSGDIASVAQGVFGREGAMKFLHYFTSNINPVITVPLQLGTGTEFFSGRSIGPDAYSGDTSATDFAISQASGPLSEFGSKLPAAFSRSTEEGVARLAMRGRVQAFDEQRLSSGVRREFREQEQRIRSAVYRAQRDGDAELSAEARARLMQLYADALRRGMEDVVPDWAERQLAELTSRAG